jgi:hypothetical protein
MRSKVLSLVIFASAMSMARGQESTVGYPANTTIKGYAKRDRVLIGSGVNLLPTQLHEITGARVGVGAEYNRTDLRFPVEQGNVRTRIDSPSATVMGAYGNDYIALGVQGSYLQGVNTVRDFDNVESDVSSTKIIPQVALTPMKNFSIGLGIEVDSITMKEEFGESEAEYKLNPNRVIAGVAYHNEFLEVGVGYNTEAQDRDRSNDQGTASLSLASTEGENERAIYLPAESRVYARANFSDKFSMLGAVSMARYDANVNGAIGAFDKYQTEDRIAAKLIGTTWTSNRSRIAVAGEYKGGATTAVGSEESGLGYRLANTYGGSVEGIVSINRQTYLGLLGGYTRGQRDDTINGERYAIRESSMKFAGTVAAKF